jgi:AcrR family transcriptional regulator
MDSRKIMFRVGGVGWTARAGRARMVQEKQWRPGCPCRLRFLETEKCYYTYMHECMYVVQAARKHDRTQPARRLPGLPNEPLKTLFAMARSTKEEALETRNRILDAAENVFHEHGVSRTSLSDVADAANVTRGAIYWHFKNKSDLFDAMCDRVRLPMEAMVEACKDENEADPVGQLRETCLFVLKEAVRNPHSHKVFDIVFHKCEFVDPLDPISIRQQACFRKVRRLACNGGRLAQQLAFRAGQL